MKRVLAFIMMLAIAVNGTCAEDLQLPLEFQSLKSKRDLAVRKIDMTYKMELEKLKVQYTKRIDLDSANIVAAAIGQIESGNPDDNSKPQGKWAITHTDERWKHGYWFDGDKARRIGPGGELGADYQMVKRNGDWLILAGDRIERVTVMGKTLFIEHFYPGSMYPQRSPQVIGRGVPMK
jgi:hypothetical protein